MSEEKLTWALLTPEDWGLRYAAAVSLQEIATPEAVDSFTTGTAQEVDKVVLSRIAIALDILLLSCPNITVLAEGGNKLEM